MPQQNQIEVGKICGVFGIQGWVKVFSYTDPIDNILSYSPWLLKNNADNKIIKVIRGKFQGKGIIAQLEDISDRDLAEALIGFDIFIDASQLPKAAAGEYYWSDLIGLVVETLDGVSLGRIDSLMETGANDVIIVQGEKERAIPFLQGSTIKTIDLAAGKMVVDWDPEF
ncbi:MAG: ribosome maturation factor RimM [Methylobacter sp.]|nr:MAG: ribosome maturation factor RimM [Methylobacter sp.]